MYIFISYRRSDTPDVSGRIYDELAHHFGDALVFKDVNDIPLGVNFSDFLDDVVRQSSVMLIVIGSGWLDVTDERGQRRLDQPDDPVRREVAAALERGIPIVPLLVQGASIPRQSELPEELATLSLHNGTRIRPDPDFHSDMGRLIKQLESHVTSTDGADTDQDQAIPRAPARPPSRAQRSRMWAALGIVTLLLVVCGSILGLGGYSPSAKATKTAQASEKTKTAESDAKAARDTATAQTREAKAATETATAQAREAKTTFRLKEQLGYTGKPQLLYGPASGSLQPAGDQPAVASAGERLVDFVAEAVLYNPRSAQEGFWFYGFAFRSVAEHEHLLLSIRETQTWTFWSETKDGPIIEFEGIRDGPVSGLDVSGDGSNRLWLAAYGDQGLLYVNDIFVAQLDLSKRLTAGDIQVIAFDSKGMETRYVDFTIWYLP